MEAQLKTFPNQAKVTRRDMYGLSLYLFSTQEEVDKEGNYSVVGWTPENKKIDSTLPTNEAQEEDIEGPVSARVIPGLKTKNILLVFLKSHK